MKKHFILSYHIENAGIVSKHTVKSAYKLNPEAFNELLDEMLSVKEKDQVQLSFNLFSDDYAETLGFEPSPPTGDAKQDYFNKNGTLTGFEAKQNVDI